MNKLPLVRVGRHKSHGLFIEAIWQCDSVTLYFCDANTYESNLVWYALWQAVKLRKVTIGGVEVKVKSDKGLNYTRTFCCLHTLHRLISWVSEKDTDHCIENDMVYLARAFPLESVLKPASQNEVWACSDERVVRLEGKRLLKRSRSMRP